MMLVAVAYVVIGIAFGVLANAHHVRLWRLAAWVASAVVAAVQIGYEHQRGSSPLAALLPRFSRRA
jgi:hypothetical protein